MGDLSAEPSMEEILSSIKRIIAEEGDTTPARGARRQSRPAVTPMQPPLVGDELDDEVLELSDPMPALRPEPRSEPVRSTRAEPTTRTTPRDPIAEATIVPNTAPTTPTLISDNAAAASRGALDQLSRLLIKPEPGSDGSLEGLVRELLRPMLSDWLDANLPALVESMVAREIKRITGQAT